MNNDWFDEDGKAKQLSGDSSTWYVETAKDAKGNYTVDMSHFWAVTADKGPYWQIGVFVQSPPDTKAAVQSGAVASNTGSGPFGQALAGLGSGPLTLPS